MDWLEGFASLTASENASGHVPKLLYIDAVLPDTTGKNALGVKKHVVFSPSKVHSWHSKSCPQYHAL